MSKKYKFQTLYFLDALILSDKNTNVTSPNDNLLIRYKQQGWQCECEINNDV